MGRLLGENELSTETMEGVPLRGRVLVGQGAPEASPCFSARLSNILQMEETQAAHILWFEHGKRRQESCLSLS